MQKKKGSSFFYFFGSVAMIVAAIALTALINFSKTDSTTTDVRARAGANTLRLVGTVVSTDETTGVIMVQNVQFAEESRSGPGKNLGTWQVTPPPSFTLSQAFAGAQLTITIQAATFDINSRVVTATEITVAR
jgi:hypothetical protein